MLLKDLSEIIFGEVEIYIDRNTHCVYRGYGCAIPEELLGYKVAQISGSHYYPYMSYDETTDCIDIELTSEG